MGPVKCRARISARCFDGRPQHELYGKHERMQDDGTWDGHSVVCDPCYVMLMPLTPSGQALLHELEGAIAAARNDQKGGAR